jgi:hypothetical protein
VAWFLKSRGEAKEGGRDRERRIISYLLLLLYLFVLSKSLRSAPIAHPGFGIPNERKRNEDS